MKMSTEMENGGSDDQYLLSIVGRLPKVDRRILPNTWAMVPDSRNRDGLEEQLYLSASVHFQVDVIYSHTSM